MSNEIDASLTRLEAQVILVLQERANLMDALRRICVADRLREAWDIADEALASMGEKK